MRLFWALLVAHAHGFNLPVIGRPVRSARSYAEQIAMEAAEEEPVKEVVAVEVAGVDKTREGEYPHPHDDDYKFGDITKRVIRDMTGNKDYEIGDGSKALASATTDAAEKAAAAVLDAGGSAVEAGAAAKKVLDDSDYQFGDLTKGAIKGFEETVRDATGNEEYKFGDVTKNLAKGLFGALEKGAAAAKKKIED